LIVSGRRRISADNNQQTMAKMAVAPISEVEKGMKKQQRTMQTIPTLLAWWRKRASLVMAPFIGILQDLCAKGKMLSRVL
jgi:hypothetical protein